MKKSELIHKLKTIRSWRIFLSCICLGIFFSFNILAGISTTRIISSNQNLTLSENPTLYLHVSRTDLGNALFEAIGLTDEVNLNLPNFNFSNPSDSIFDNTHLDMDDLLNCVKNFNYSILEDNYWEDHHIEKPDFTTLKVSDIFNQVSITIAQPCSFNNSGFIDTDNVNLYVSIFNQTENTIVNQTNLLQIQIPSFQANTFTTFNIYFNFTIEVSEFEQLSNSYLFLGRQYLSFRIQTSLMFLYPIDLELKIRMEAL